MPLSAELVDELRIQVGIGWPVAASMFLNRMLPVSSILFLGHSVSSRNFAGAMLAMTLANVSGMSVLVGLAGATSTLCAQAHGAGAHHLLGEYLRRSLAVLALACVPISAAWWFAAPVLRALGQAAPIAAAATGYLRGLIPSLWAWGVCQSCQAFLQAQGITRPLALVSAAAAAAHVALNWALICALGLGLGGGAAAASVSQCAVALGQVAVVVLQPARGAVDTASGGAPAATGGGCTRAVLCTGWGEFLRLAAPGVLMISEWWASEIAVIASGNVAAAARSLSVMALYQTTNSICFMFSLAFHVAAITRVGNALGAGDSAAARRGARVAAVSCAACLSCVALALALGRHEWAAAFTDDASVRMGVSRAVLVNCVYVIADGVQTALSGVLKGVGMQAQAGKVVVFSYFAVGLPVGGLLAFDRLPAGARGMSLGVIGLCIGMAIGTACHMALLAVIVSRIDWDAEASQIAAGLAKAAPERAPRTVASKRARGYAQLASSDAGAVELPDAPTVPDGV